MRIFNKGLRTIQHEGGSVAPKGNVTVSDEIGNRLKGLYPSEILDLNSNGTESNSIIEPVTNEGPQPKVGPTTGAGAPLTPEEEARIAADSEAAEKLRQDSLKKPDTKENDSGNVKISPAAQEYADANGIDVSTLKGSGLNGLITKADVQAAIDEKDNK